MAEKPFEGTRRVGLRQDRKLPRPFQTQYPGTQADPSLPFLSLALQGKSIRRPASCLDHRA